MILMFCDLPFPPRQWFFLKLYKLPPMTDSLVWENSQHTVLSKPQMCSSTWRASNLWDNLNYMYTNYLDRWFPRTDCKAFLNHKEPLNTMLTTMTIRANQSFLKKTGKRLKPTTEILNWAPKFLTNSFRI